MGQYTYAILGAGRQGTSAAYNLAKFGEAKKKLSWRMFRKKPLFKLPNASTS
jgi:thioredoxin reductase